MRQTPPTLLLLPAWTRQDGSHKGVIRKRGRPVNIKGSGRRLAHPHAQAPPRGDLQELHPYSQTELEICHKGGGGCQMCVCHSSSQSWSGQLTILRRSSPAMSRSSCPETLPRCGFAQKVCTPWPVCLPPFSVQMSQPQHSVMEQPRKTRTSYSRHIGWLNIRGSIIWIYFSNGSKRKDYSIYLVDVERIINRRKHP